jgi:hypothetical protein
MNRSRRFSTLLFGLTILVLTLGGMNAAALAQTPGLSAPIEGSWISVVTLTQDPTVSFTTLSSFAAGGIFVATGSNDRIVRNSPLYGSWRRTGSNRFGVSAFFFTFDPSGAPIAMLRTNQSLQLNNKDELVGMGDLSFCDLNGNNCNPIDGANIQLVGKRIVP